MTEVVRVNDWTMIPVDKLLAGIGDCPFEKHGITKEMVQESLRTGSYGMASESYSHARLPIERSPEWHAQRVAYLVRYGWEHPIEIDVGIPSVGFYPYPLQDGHHRLCAAIIRGDTHIRAEVSGALEHAFEIFGVDCSLYGECDA